MNCVLSVFMLHNSVGMISCFMLISRARNHQFINWYLVISKYDTSLIWNKSISLFIYLCCWTFQEINKFHITSECCLYSVGIDLLLTLLFSSLKSLLLLFQIKNKPFIVTIRKHAHAIYRDFFSKK